ncbi:hypothetical protein M501DRAFT_1006059 [Patellaria atrata CBS 101060]|uniref:Uncharacterized protein n=1 Tax=Patellaria atrata CBS 101060 TaxID=1346257 RepID=A0A9P4SID2_9PEZI|nr:hypothetical protein M501DRAFT_1006059 [Patellaria atrata CBS 101060]
MVQSPSLPDLGPDPFRTHSRNNSDANVQGMVARFNALEIRDHKEAMRRDEIAIRRSEMAREMAELELLKVKEEKAAIEKDSRRIREEARKMKKEIEEGKDRERKVAKRLEVVMEELYRAKDTHGHAQALYEKEIRRARKEAFKSSSAIVKVQEELKATRNTLRITESGLQSEKMKLAKREQEAFSAQYQLIAVQSEWDKARERITIVEQERDALKTSLKEEEVARIAAEGSIALPTTNLEDEDDEFASPVRSPRKHRRFGSDKENVSPQRRGDIKVVQELQEELEAERRRRKNAEEQIDFMKMECQFQCCSCRIAEQNRMHYVHDDSYAEEIERIKASVPHDITPPGSPHAEDEMEIEDTVIRKTSAARDPSPSEPQEPMDRTPINEDIEMAFSPSTGTFHRIPSPLKQLHSISEAMSEYASTTTPETPIIPATELDCSPVIETEREAESEQAEQSTTFHDKTEDEPESEIQQSYDQPQTPIQTHPHPIREIRTITTTTTIPIQFSPYPAHTIHSHPMSTPKNITNLTTPRTISNVPSQSAATKLAFSADPTEVKENRDPETGEKNMPPPGTGMVGGPLIDREAALEQIRQRRGRARSMAAGQATPRRQMVEGVVRRDISAPAFGAMGKGP